MGRQTFSSRNRSVAFTGMETSIYRGDKYYLVHEKAVVLGKVLCYKELFQTVLL